jgi:hypothetical protein
MCERKLKYFTFKILNPPPPPQNDAIGAVTNRYFPVTVESGRVPHREDSDRLLRETITINVPLFKKLRDIIFFGGENHFMSHFEGHFEGAKTFLTP